ncbi:MAG: hypothetical protein ACLPWF_18645 [Bryobacteraceae bacterium]
MSKLFSRSAIAVLACALPIAAFAQTNATLSSGGTLNLESGAVGTSGGDLSWNGTALIPVSNATAVDLTSVLGSAYSGQTQFTQLAKSASAEIAALSSFQGFLTNSAITPAVNDIIVAQDNSSNYALLLVTSLSGGSISLEFQTFKGSSSGGGGGGTTPSGPNITSVVNNYSYIPVGFPNSGIAPGTIFLIFGSGMSSSPPNVVLQSSAGAGIPKTLEGATLSVTGSDGKNYTPGFYYATPGQIAAVLPSKTPTGPATITVSYNGATSNAFQFQVVNYALGINTYFGTGTGLVLATDTSGNIFNYTNSAKPGQTIVMYGSGLGADPADSDYVFTSAPHAVNTPLKIYIGGIPATILYAGSSGYPGYDQIDLTIPENAPSDCFVGLVGVTGSGSSATVSNFGNLPISPSGGDCTSSILGLTGTSITSLSGQGTVRSGSVVVEQIVEPAIPPATGTTTDNIASADFSKTTGSSFGSANGAFYSLGSCFVSEVISSGGGNVKSTGLDAGKSIGLTGPAGSYTLTQSSFSKGLYEEMLPSGAIPSTGGTFTFTGTGGTDVGSFTASVTFPNPILQWTNQSVAATITRTQGVTVDWTGGSPGTYVIISGSSSDQNTGAFGNFTCIAPQSALTFTVPSYVTLTLPAGTGNLAVENGTNFGTFTATGLDHGATFGFTGVDVSSTYQ